MHKERTYDFGTRNYLARKNRMQPDNKIQTASFDA